MALNILSPGAMVRTVAAANCRVGGRLRGGGSDWRGRKQRRSVSLIPGPRVRRKRSVGRPEAAGAAGGNSCGKGEGSKKCNLLNARAKRVVVSK